MATQSNNHRACLPFLKWAGGKRWLADSLASLLSQGAGTYFEPFLGAGAVFFSLRPKDAVLADINEDLIYAFKAVRDQPEALIRRLSRLSPNAKTFVELREAQCSSVLGSAVRLIYLNRTAFNGIYRVNRLGKFNVPFGCKPGTKVCDAERIRACALGLSDVNLSNRDFRSTLELASGTAKVYIDPPYTVKHNNNAFRRYNEHIFSWKDQERLAEISNDLARKGARVVITNARHDDVLSLYSADSFLAAEVRRHSCMAGKPEYRASCTELLLVSQTIADSAHRLQEIVGCDSRILVSEKRLTRRVVRR